MDTKQLLIKRLEQYVNKSIVDEELNFYLIKELVGQIRNMKIEIYSNDHNPPHFHVKSQDKTIDATFRLDNGEMINGKLTKKDKKRIEKFFEDERNQELMKEMWNKSKSDNKKVN